MEWPTSLRPILERAEEFVKEELVPLEKTFLRGVSFEEFSEVLEEKREKVRKLGLFAPHIPKEYGGVGLSLVEFAYLSEILGQTPLGHYVFNCQAPDVGNMELLIAHGTKEQKRKVLEPLVKGEIRSCFAMTEPQRAGSNPVWLDTTAKLSSGGYVIEGRKWFATGGEGAAFAIVMAVTNPEAPPHKRASQILVPLDTPGVRWVQNIPVMGHAGDGWFGHAEFLFENCRVPQENLIGEEGEGFALAQERLGPGRIHHCMRWIGICERALDCLCRRAASRELAPGKLLGQTQIVQQWVAESRAEIDAARLMVLRTAWVIQEKGSREAREAISLIKFFVAGVLQRVVDRAIQAHGALGLTDETPLSFFYRSERAARIYDGADEVHKLSVGRRILKRYGVERRGV